MAEPGATAALDRRPDWRLGDEQVAAFARDGFVGPVAVLDRQQLERVRAAVAAVLADLRRLEPQLYEVEAGHLQRPGEVVCHFLGGFRVHPVLRELVFLPAVTVPCAQLLGVERLRFWHDQVFAKPPHHPGVVPWHQDYSYWTRTAPLAHLTVWIALDDATVENGCVHFVPGSHRWPLLPKPRLAGEMDAIRTVLDAAQLAAFRPVANELQAGEASFHHPLMLHGSFANRSPRPRRAVVINVVKDGVRSESDEPLLTGVPVVPKGQPLGGRFFPLLFDPACAAASR